MNTDTPLPPDEPAGKNPPDGAIIDYYLGTEASGAVTLEVLDSAGRPVRRYSSEDPVQPVDPMLAIPLYWVRPPQVLSKDPGMHRFLWDMHYTPVTRARSNFPMQAVAHDTPPAETSPSVMPGNYTIKLTVDGRAYTQPLTVKMDPRVHTSSAGLAQQFSVSKQVYDDVLAAAKALDQIRGLRAQLHDRAGQSAVSGELTAFDQKLAAIQGTGGFGRGGGGGRGAAPGPDTLTSVSATLSQLLESLQNADVPPTTQAIAAVSDRRAALARLVQRWTALKTTDLGNLNERLKQEKLPVLTP